MQQYFNDQTNVPSFSLQSNDWFFLTSMIRGNDEQYDDMTTQLKQIQRTSDPAPSGSTTMAVTDTYLGVILNLYYLVEMKHGKEIGKTSRNRFRTALEAIQATYPVITTFFTDLAARENSDENALVDIGRKWLRGKTGN